MMELKFVVQVEVPDRAGRRAIMRAARDVMLKLAAELIRCSVASDTDDDDERRTTRA